MAETKLVVALNNNKGMYRSISDNFMECNIRSWRLTTVPVPAMNPCFESRGVPKDGMFTLWYFIDVLKGR